MHRVSAAVVCLWGVVAGDCRAQQLPLTPFLILYPGLPEVRHVACGDLDLDGVPDVLLANGFGQAFGGPWRVLRMTPAGAAAGGDSLPEVSTDPWLQSVAVAPVDADGDRLADVVAADGRGVLRLYQNGGPGQRRAAGQPFLPPVVLQDLALDLGLRGAFTVGVPWLQAADLDGDGRQDVLFAGELTQGTGAPVSLGLRLYLGDASGRFANRSVAATPLATAWAAADFDGDHQSDVLVASGTGTVDRFQLQAGALVTGARQTLAEALLPTAMAAGDLDGDHVPELVIAGNPGLTPRLLVVHTDTFGTFQGGRGLTLPASAWAEVPAVCVADLDGDGMADVLALCAAGRGAPARLFLFRGLGGGQLAAAVSMALPGPIAFRFLGVNQATPQPHLLAVTDFDRDGVPDVVVAGLEDATGAPRLAVARGIAPARCMASSLGTAAAGGGGFAPRIGTAGGLPWRGNQEFGFTLRDAAGDGAVAVLCLGQSTVETALGEGLVFYTWPRVVDVRRTVGHGAGGGHAIVPCPIPLDPQLAGLSCRAQWVVADWLAPRSVPFSTSDALELVLGG